MYRRRTALSSAAPEAASGGRTSRPSSAISSVSPGRGTRVFWRRFCLGKTRFIRPAGRQYRPARRAGFLRHPGDGAVSHRPRPRHRPAAKRPGPRRRQQGRSGSGAAPCGDLPQSGRPRVLVTSAETGEGIEALREALAGKLSCLTGNSGVGKSSLLNCACPQSSSCPFGEVSEKLGRGRHTTRHIELYSLGSKDVRRRYPRLLRVRHRAHGAGAQGAAAICLPGVRSVSRPLPVSRLRPPERARLRRP